MSGCLVLLVLSTQGGYVESDLIPTGACTRSWLPRPGSKQKKTDAEADLTLMSNICVTHVSPVKP